MLGISKSSRAERPVRHICPQVLSECLKQEVLNQSSARVTASFQLFRMFGEIPPSQINAAEPFIKYSCESLRNLFLLILLILLILRFLPRGFSFSSLSLLLRLSAPPFTAAPVEQRAASPAHPAPPPRPFKQQLHPATPPSPSTGSSTRQLHPGLSLSQQQKDSLQHN